MRATCTREGFSRWQPLSLVSTHSSIPDQDFETREDLLCKGGSLERTQPTRGHWETCVSVAGRFGTSGFPRPPHPPSLPPGCNRASL